jgi:hypothetical protein
MGDQIEKEMYTHLVHQPGFPVPSLLAEGPGWTLKAEMRRMASVRASWG